MDNDFTPDALKGAKVGLRKAKLMVADAMVYIGNLTSTSEVISRLLLHDEIIEVIDALGTAIKKLSDIQDKVKN